MKNRVQIYNDMNDDTELEIIIPKEVMQLAVEKTQWFKDNFNQDEHFTSFCDWCGKECETYHFFPELGHKVSCDTCAKNHKKIVEWYTEDLHYVFNSIITFLQTYDLQLSDNDYKEIDEFFGSKGHYEIHIERFLEKGKTK